MGEPMTPTTLAETILRDVPETKTARNPPPVEYIRKRLRYEPDTGKLFWLDYEGMSTWWRTRYAGKETFTTYSGNGYRSGTIDDVMYRGHRVCWALYHGAWPPDQIDHINGIRWDNRISNLRAVTMQENSKNLGMRSDNATGVTGVTFDARYDTWQARIKAYGKDMHLGSFKTKEEAVAARTAAAKLLGYSERHGLPFPAQQLESRA